MRTVFQYTFLLFTIFCTGTCGWMSKELVGEAFMRLIEYGHTNKLLQIFSDHSWIFPFLTFFGVFAIIFEIKFLVFESSIVKSAQLDDIFIQNDRSFSVKKRFKMGYSLFCAGLLAFGIIIMPLKLTDRIIGSEEILVIAIPTFFAIAGYIYFFDILKKQKEISIRT